MRHPFLAPLAAILAVFLATNLAEARPRRAVSAPAISVDVSRLRALGLTVEADLIQATVARELAGASVAGRLVVQVTGLSLNAYAGSTSGGGRSSSGNLNFDYLEGDFHVLGPRSEVLAGRHIVASAPASSGGPIQLPGGEARRIQTVAQSLAGWIRRYAS